MSNVAVLFQFRRAFPQERVGSDCAILNRQFQKKGVFSFNSHRALQGIEGFVANKRWLSNFNSQLAVSKNGLSSFNSQPAVSKNGCSSFNSQPAVSENGFSSFNSQPAVSKRGNEGPKKKGCLQGRLAIFHQKRAKSGSFCPVSSHVPTKKNRYSTAAFPCKGSDCAIPSRQFQKTAFSVSIPTKHCSSLRVLLPTRMVFPVSISGRQFQKTAFPVSIPSRQFQKTAF